jgi:MoaA/NifB/PqqE/SkfB family radical SAM enzyme
MKISYKAAEYKSFLEGCYQHPVVLLEISSICNFQCVYCVSKDKTRAKQFMSEELFRHIIQQIPSLTPYPLRLHVDGEPTLHPKFFEFAKILNEANIPFVLATNGSRLTPEMVNLEMTALISISTSNAEFKLRAPSLNYRDYINNICSYLEAWLPSDSKQSIYIQIPYRKNVIRYIPQLYEKRKFITAMEKRLKITDFAEKKVQGNLVTDFKIRYKKPNGSFLCFYSWTIQDLMPYKAVREDDKKTTQGFCSRPWQEMAILADGRVSFCCVDLTGGTAYTSKEEIWKRALIDLWMDTRIINIRKEFLQGSVRVPVCQRCITSFPNNEVYTTNHPYNKSFASKSRDLFPVDSVGEPRQD